MVCGLNALLILVASDFRAEVAELSFVLMVESHDPLFGVRVDCDPNGLCIEPQRETQRAECRGKPNIMRGEPAVANRHDA